MHAARCLDQHGVALFYKVADLFDQALLILKVRGFGTVFSEIV